MFSWINENYSPANPSYLGIKLSLKGPITTAADNFFFCFFFVFCCCFLGFFLGVFLLLLFSKENKYLQSSAVFNQKVLALTVIYVSIGTGKNN